MDRRGFLATLGLFGVGLCLPAAGGALRWGRRRACPGMRVRVQDLALPSGGAWLVVVAHAEDEAPRQVARMHLRDQGAPSWRVPALAPPPRGQRCWYLDARLEDGSGRALARTDAPLEVRVRRLWFGV